LILKYFYILDKNKIKLGSTITKACKVKNHKQNLIKKQLNKNNIKKNLYT